MTNKPLQTISFVLYLIIVSILLLEIIFWILPTAELFEKENVNNNQPVLKYKPNQSINFSLGADFYQVAKKNTNNHGFVNSDHYEKNSKPYLAVIGDSFVEAMQIDFDDSISGVLKKNTGKTVYSFAVSGASLSQYIACAKYVEKTYDPQNYIFVIIENDFDQSICSIKESLPTNYYEGQFCYDKNWNLKLNEFNGYSLINSIARKSNFIRYAVLNVGINPRTIFTNRKDIHGIENDNTKSIIHLENLSYKVIDLFLKDIFFITKGKPVYLILDADRNQIYRNTNKNSYFNKMRNYIKNLNTYENFKTIDLKMAFEKNFRDTRTKPEFITDSHWNELGHMIASQAFLKEHLKSK